MSSDPSRGQSPITFTTSPRLSLALHGNGAGFEQTMEAVGSESTIAWLRNRVGDAVDPDLLTEEVQAWFGAPPGEDRVMPRVELAELLGDADEATAEQLWDASMTDGFARDDGEQAFDAVTHLAQLAEGNGDPLAAAEYYIDFLNWRRQDAHFSDPEAVHQAFEEIIRLAEADDAAAAAARFTHAHAEFARASEDNADVATEGDWAPQRPPLAGWE